MRKKSIVLALILIITSAGVGTSFSLAIGTFRANGTIDSDYGVNFTAVSYSDNEEDKEVADGIVLITGTQNILVTISNAYPGYEAYVDFTIKNTREGVIFFDLLDIIPQNSDAIYIEGFVDISPFGLIPEQTCDGQISIEVLQAAVMGENYHFEVNISFDSSPQP